jgi:hypothetical protein
VLATIAAMGGGFIAGVKTWPDVVIVVVAQANRERLLGELIRRVQSQ